MSTEPHVEPVDYTPPPHTLWPPGPTAPEGHAAPYGEWGVIDPHEGLVDHGHPRRRPWLPRSLTSRLVAGVVALVVLLVLATGVGTYVALKSFLYNRLDQQVAEAAREPLEQLFAGGTINGPGVSAPQKVYVVAYTSAGRTLQPPPGSEVEPMLLSSGDRTSLINHVGKLRTVQTTNGQRLRARATNLNLVQNGVVVGQLQSVVGLSTSEVDRTLKRLVNLELIIGVSAVVLALVATSYGVRYSLRRLHGVTRTAQEVAAELSPSGSGLERRVEVHEPDTEVGQLAMSMNTLLAAVETQFAERVASEDRMRQFLADASHELRTPLTSIRGYAELARMQGSDGDRDNMSRIEAEGTRMSRLVDDLLTLARTDQGGDRQHDVLDVSGMLTDAVEGVRAAHPDRRIDVTAEHGLAVVGDRDQLVRVIRNLTTNAAVHTRPDGPIRVSASHESGFVVVRVSDSGPGLAPEEAAHVFERFWRADKARSRAQGGSGLGMSIVAALVQEHGGYVTFDSTAEGGSTVTVRLPRA